VSAADPGVDAPPSGAVPPPPASPAAPPQPTGVPWLGLLAVLMGTFISTLTGRLSSFGLADIRGALDAGFDDGAWITTAQTVAQMLIAPFAVWAGSIHGPRVILLVAALAFAAISVVIPFSPNLPTLLSLQFIGGLASGCFIPLTLSFILRNMAMRLWAYGIALYALNLELSLNISASLEGWYVEHFSWHWIFWQNVPLALIMAVCLHFGVQSATIQSTPIRRDLFGVVSFGAGLALIYAALDQGNRLDWLRSGLIWGLLLAGLVLLAAFILHEILTPHPWLNLRLIIRGPLPLLLLNIAFLRLTINSTAFLIPQYLESVRNFRALQVGDTLIWIAIPQLVICPISALILRRFDPRIAPIFGLGLIASACLVVANGLTPDWGSDEFLVSQLIQALGQSLALSGIIFFGVLHSRPEDALTFGAMLQVARLMGGEVGQAYIATFSRLREQRASNLIGQHLRIGDGDVVDRLRAYAGIAGRSGTPDTEAGTSLLGGVVHAMATTQSVIDAFVTIAVAVVFAFLIPVLLDPPPRGPASHIPLFSRKSSVES
jgi:DHA2 family multidrug resistance protein